jgi:CheY-like chemotaxis protein
MQALPLASVAERELEDSSEPAPPAWDDRDGVVSGDRVVLIVENDPRFAELALETAREQGWKALVAGSGAEAVALASEFKPDGITLDLRLPDIDGMRVLRRLKADPETRHLRVQVISTDDGAQRALGLGAAGVLAKPLSGRGALEEALQRLRQHAEQPPRELLVPGDLPEPLEDLLRGSGAQLRRVDAWDQAGAASPGVAGAVLDGRDSPLDVARELRELRPDLPVLVYAPAVEPRPAREDGELARRGLMLATRPEELLDRVVGMLHQPLDALAPDVRKVLEQRYAAGEALAGRRALVVDDDVRNIFALTSVLEDHEMVVLSAESGTAAIELLQEPDVADVVLMDLMMPGVDGFETIRTIRAMPGLRSLPIIAVTAKAMKGDRERTIEAGAWDYLSKPVEPERILRVLRAWLHA